ncbi:MAG: FlgD immunoglobulin-like domain containing protein, partial [Candidatus Zixiibacteriota bacterium]
TTDFASDVTIEISNIDGVVVRTLSQEDVAAGSNSIVWDGKDSDGNRLEAGYYTISITATDANGDTFAPSTYVEGRVTAVYYRDGSAYLKVNGLEIALSEVTSIKEVSTEDEG